MQLSLVVALDVVAVVWYCALRSNSDGVGIIMFAFVRAT